MKPWIVMVHGLSQDHRVFSSQVEAFQADYRILLVDLPGHGLASAIGGPFGHVEFADHVERTLAGHAVEDIHYWGTHTGATIGLLLAANNPGLFRSLVLESPLIPGANPPVVLENISRAKAAVERDGLAAALTEWWQEGCWFDHMRANPQSCRAEEHRRIVQDFGGRPWTDSARPAAVTGIETLLAELTAPALVYNGVTDHPDFIAAARTIAGLMPNAVQATIPNAGGFPAWENPDEVNRLVAGFISRMDRSAAPAETPQ